MEPSRSGLRLLGVRAGHSRQCGKNGQLHRAKLALLERFVDRVLRRASVLARNDRRKIVVRADVREAISLAYSIGTR